MTTTLLRRTKPDAYGIVEGPPPFTAIFLGPEGDGLRGWAYSYVGGQQGALLDQQDFPDMGALAQKAVVTYSPLRIAIQGSGGPLYLWDVAAATVITHMDHPVSGYSWCGVCSGGDGYAYWTEHVAAAAPDYHTFKLFRIDAAGVVSQVGQASNALNAAIGFAPVTSNDVCFVDGTFCFFPVPGPSANAGVIQIPIAGGDKPRYRASDQWLPGDLTTAWLGWFSGGRVPGQPRAIGWNVDTGTFGRLRVSLLRGHTGGDPALFASEPLVDPISLPLVDTTPSADGLSYAISMYDGVDAQVGLVPMEETAEADLVLYTVEDAPGWEYPVMVVPA